jgi:hypothetical protein
MAIGLLVFLLGRATFGPVVVNAAQGGGPFPRVRIFGIDFECTADVRPNDIICRQPQPPGIGQVLALGDVSTIDQKPIDSVCTPD